VHMLPTSKTSLHKLLRDVNIAFRIYSRQLSQKIPSKIGEAHLSMTDILKSETFSSCKDIAVLNTTKIPECQVPIGVLKVTVELGSEQKYFGNNFVEKISNEGWGTEADSDYGGVKLGIHEYNTEASLKHVSDPRPAPKHHASNISRRFFKNRRKIISCNINMDPEFSKNSQQKTELEDQVLDSSLSETSLNKVRHYYYCYYYYCCCCCCCYNIITIIYNSSLSFSVLSKNYPSSFSVGLCS